MSKALRHAGQGVAYALFGAALVVLSQWPPYVHSRPGEALVTLSFVHSGAHRGECRTRSAEELRALAPNMRKIEVCPRGRVALWMELDLDGRPLFAAALPAAGLADDGPARVYENFVLPAGPHRIEARMRDTTRADGGFDHRASAEIALASGTRLVVDFRPNAGGFTFK